MGNAGTIITGTVYIYPRTDVAYDGTNVTWDSQSISYGNSTVDTLAAVGTSVPPLFTGTIAVTEDADKLFAHNFVARNISIEAGLPYTIEFVFSTHGNELVGTAAYTVLDAILIDNNVEISLDRAKEILGVLRTKELPASPAYVELVANTPRN